MKSAYELAMERLGDKGASNLSDEQKAALAEVDEKFKAKIAEREVFLGGLIEEAKAQANFIEIQQLSEQLAREVAKFQEQCEAEKEKIRNSQ